MIEIEGLNPTGYTHGLVEGHIRGYEQAQSEAVQAVIALMEAVGRTKVEIPLATLSKAADRVLVRWENPATLTVTFELQDRWVHCDTCSGTGEVPLDLGVYEEAKTQPCPDCGGKGKWERHA